MIGTNSLALRVLQPQSVLARRLLQAAITAFLAFGLAVPPMAAKCASKDLSRPINPVPSAILGPIDGGPIGPLQPLNFASIVGLWNVTFTSGGQVVDVAFDAWHSDGTEILNDYTDPIEGNVCLGVWEQTGVRSYRLKHPSWSFDQNGNLLGTVVIRETIQLDPSGNSYKGAYTYDIYDTSGDFLEEFTGTISATRIRPN